MDYSGGILPCWNIMSCNQCTGTCLLEMPALVLGVFVKQIKLIWNYRVQRMLILPVVHQLAILMGENFQVPTWLFPTTSLRLLQMVTLSSLTACLCSSTVSRNLGRRMLNQWLFQVYQFENGVLPRSHLTDSLARQKISAEDELSNMHALNKEDTKPELF